MPVKAPRASEELTVKLPDGRLLGYAEYGDPDGAPVVGFHGTPGSRYMFRLAHASAQELGLRFLAPERPGFGISSPHVRRTLKSYAADIAAFADCLGIKRFAVAGVSGGAPYAAACAALLPERVTAVALVSPVGPMAGEEKPRSIGAGHYFLFRVAPRLMPLLAGIFAIGRGLFLYAPQIVYGFIMARCAPSDWKILARSDVRRNLLNGVAEGMRPGIRSGLQEMRIFSQVWDIPFRDIAAPTYLWQGTADRNVSTAAALRLGELIPNTQVIRIEKAGHYWIFDNIRTVLVTLAAAARSAESRRPGMPPLAKASPNP